MRNCKEGNKIWKIITNIMNPDYYVVILNSKSSEINKTTSKDFNFMLDSDPKYKINKTIKFFSQKCISIYQLVPALFRFKSYRKYIRNNFEKNKLKRYYNSTKYDKSSKNNMG